MLCFISFMELCLEPPNVFLNQLGSGDWKFGWTMLKIEQMGEFRGFHS